MKNIILLAMLLSLMAACSQSKKSNNTPIGYAHLYDNTTGTSSTAFGLSALQMRNKPDGVGISQGCPGSSPYTLEAYSPATTYDTTKAIVIYIDGDFVKAAPCIRINKTEFFSYGPYKVFVNGKELPIKDIIFFK